MNIQELIEARRDGRSNPAISRDGGGKPSVPRIQQITRKGVEEFPDLDTICGLAQALHVTERTVADAYLESLGVPAAPVPRLALLAPPGAEDLTDDELNVVHGVIRLVLRTRTLGKAERGEVGSQ